MGGWFRKAADQGFANAQYDLGYIHENGFGVSPDRQLAMEWYSRAANQGHAGARDRLSAMNAGGVLMGVLKRVMGLGQP